MKTILFILIMLISITVAQQKTLDFSECNLQLTNYEFVEELENLEPEKEDSRIMVIRVEGISPSEGSLTSIPTLFNIQYTNEDNRSEISPSRAFGLKGKDQNGNYTEHWLTVEDNFFDVSYLEYDKGSKIILYFAFDLPEYVKEFDLLLPKKTETFKIN